MVQSQQAQSQHDQLKDSQMFGICSCLTIPNDHIFATAH